MDTKDQELRDFFAAMAMCGLLAYPNEGYNDTEAATTAYLYADAMMESRKPK